MKNNTKKYLFNFYILLCFILYSCKNANYQNTIEIKEFDRPYSDALTQQELDILDHLPEAPKMDASSVILPNGMTSKEFSEYLESKKKKIML